jgi:uncharacterized protein YkwD
VILGIVSFGVFILLTVGAFWYFYENPIMLPYNLSVQNTFPDLISKEPESTASNNFQSIKKELVTLTSQVIPPLDSKEMESLIFDITNELREKNNLKTLEYDSELSDVARGHSSDMSARDYFSHETPEGFDPTDRGQSLGYSCTKVYWTHITYGIAENIAKFWSFSSYFSHGSQNFYDWNSEESLAQEIMDGWMDSPGHRKNILEENFDKLGVGVSVGTDGAVYATQNFC